MTVKIQLTLTDDQVEWLDKQAKKRKRARADTLMALIEELRSQK